MDKATAKKIAQSGITWGQIQEMLETAQDTGPITGRSRVNRNFTKRQSFDILYGAAMEYPPGAIVRGVGDRIGAQNALREFGDYWMIEDDRDYLAEQDASDAYMARMPCGSDDLPF